MLPPCVGLPFSLRWLPTNSNIAVDDGKGLEHIPYINDKVIENEMNFIEELIELNGNNNTNFNVVREKEKVELVNRLFKEEKKLSNVKLHGPSDDLFAGVAKVVGCDAESLKELFNRENAKAKGIEIPDEPDKVNPSIDDNSTNWTPPQRENILSSFRSLICPRCFKPPTEHYELFRKLDIKRVENPCCEDCYLHVDDLHKNIEKVSKKYKKSRNEETEIFLQNFKKEDIQKEPWSDPDKLILSRLRRVYKDKFCAMAKCLKTKTCLQVCHYCISYGPGEESGIDTENAEWLITSSPPPKKRPGSNFTKKKTNKTKDQVNSHNFEPCDHPGESCGPRCPCVTIGNFCEKFCVCNKDCPNRFPGCSCRAGCATKACPCFSARRECDPDICKLCGADNFGTEEDGNKQAHESRVCQNVKIQRGQRQHLLLAPSDVAGWGIYIKDQVAKGDFISEYCGELISQEEGDRRGRLYDKFKCSFLFDLNSHYCIDATKKGNKIRFANHSMQPNCEARVLRVNGDHRIGIFAKKDIQRGEELFFDYRYNQTDSLKYVALEKTT